MGIGACHRLFPDILSLCKWRVFCRWWEGKCMDRKNTSRKKREIFRQVGDDIVSLKRKRNFNRAKLSNLLNTELFAKNWVKH